MLSWIQTPLPAELNDLYNTSLDLYTCVYWAKNTCGFFTVVSLSPDTRCLEVRYVWRREKGDHREDTSIITTLKESAYVKGEIFHQTSWES
jgi:hypothetical protein